jgi:hypothetical protein
MSLGTGFSSSESIYMLIIMFRYLYASYLYLQSGFFFKLDLMVYVEFFVGILNRAIWNVIS